MKGERRWLTTALRDHVLAWAVRAGHMNYDICVLSLSSEGLTDDRLELALSNVPQQSLILLEDIDAAFTQRQAVRFVTQNLTVLATYFPSALDLNSSTFAT
eukprot:SAG11_NODE_108_length_16386_cov_20.828329_8_plen_101_part_00